MPLVTLRTNFKNLKFGKDRPGGGSSNQPYITKDIPSGDPSNIFNTGGTDSLLRGGLMAPLKAANDVSRLTQMFFDLKSPNGLLFTAKQNVLSRSSVETEATKGPAYGGKAVNQGIYTPLNTIAQAAAGFTGTHLNLLGLDPSSPMAGVVGGGIFPSLGLNRYEDVVKLNNQEDNNSYTSLERVIEKEPNPDYQPLILGSERPNFQPEELTKITYKVNGGFTNRLLNIWENKQLGTDNSPNILEYSGGPGSILGIGKTQIKFADQRTGDRNPKIANAQGSLKGKFKLAQQTNYNLYLGVSNLMGFGESETGINSEGQLFRLYGGTQDNSTLSKNNILGDLKNLKGYQSGISYYRNVVQEDFRKPLLEGEESSNVMSFAPNYNPSAGKTIESRVNLGNPGKSTKNIINYGIKASDIGTEALDKLTALPLYESVGPNINGPINDLVKFRIASINNDRTDGTAVYMHFRAFINSFDDQYNATWNPVQYVGRGDSLYNYSGFTRGINMSFTAMAQSKAELIPMYTKLNYLASTLTPDYTEAGFMRGNLVRLTMGGYLYEQPGFFTSLTYTIPQDSTWEVAIDKDGGYDKSVKELAHRIDVSLSFTPIHDFLPRKPKSIKTPDQRYIALSTGRSDKGNYNDWKAYDDKSKKPN